MYAIAIDRRQVGQHLNLLTEMFRLRRRVFRDRLEWNVSACGDLEIDIYDAVEPTYLVVFSQQNDVIGCVRLLPTTGPNMLADTFSVLLAEREAPRDAAVLESSRFCIDTKRATELGRNGLNRATLILFAAMLEAMQARSARSIVTVTDTVMERILRRAGWPLERLAPPQQIGETNAVAGFLHNSESALQKLYSYANCDGPVLGTADAGRHAA
ncbi:GNAT family N-acetyltransferase [Bradyrhizobium sp. WSM 1704]|uniref:acyl-homoserine-lactone synthase n=1 Tax=Bradyrhizobium semiaridum TaxID=2821404 RepID=UPI001CE232B2|nr:acyl-homoserine-lactone synthase [Bradyrhizobium semiaridum]MCA6121278.1 GNAT family N-acetyltransferase [Bradyrhizobium semiaridum]